MSRGALFWPLFLSGIICFSLAAKLSKNPLFKTEEHESKRCTCNNNNNNNDQWLNEATGHFMYECTGRHSIHVIASEYVQQYRDRRWRMSCGYNKAVKDCEWSTHYVNDWDKTLEFDCPHDGFITGIESVYRKANYDRKFKFKCCLAHDYETKNCITSAYVNAWKMPFETVIPRDKKYHLVGMSSIHENKFQDRRWKFTFCQLSYKHNKKR